MHQYMTVYTILFSVMFGLMVTTSQQLGAFRVLRWIELVKLISAVTLIVVLPMLFFVFALPKVAQFPGIITLDKKENLITILYWVTPVYGFQQAWLPIARWQKWVKAEEVLSGRAISWMIAFFFFGLGPSLHLTYMYVGERVMNTNWIQTIQIFLDFLSRVAWAIVIPLLVILFHLKYKPFIRNILINFAERVKTLKEVKGPKGTALTFGDQAEQLKPAKQRLGPPTLLVDEASVREEIEAEAKAEAVAEADKKWVGFLNKKVLPYIRSLRQQMDIYQKASLYEPLYLIIYGSQIEFLRHLQEQASPSDGYANSLIYYGNFLQRWVQLRPDLPVPQFAQWISFLDETGLIRIVEGKDIILTSKGDDFLSYIQNYSLRPF